MDTFTKVYFFLKLMFFEQNNNGYTVKEIKKIMNSNGVEISEKTLYRYLDHIEELGIDIINKQGRFMLNNFLFSSAEIQVLVDHIYDSIYLK